jgi:hypothetical protein
MEDSLPATVLVKEDPDKLAKLYQRMEGRSNNSRGPLSSPPGVGGGANARRGTDNEPDEDKEQLAKRAKHELVTMEATPSLTDQPQSQPQQQQAALVPAVLDSGATTSSPLQPSTSSATTPSSLDRNRATKQGTITNMFGSMTQKEANAMVQEAKREAEEYKRKNSDLADALRQAHERAEEAERETEMERKRYKRELVTQLKEQCKVEYEEARRSLATACLKYGTVKWERHGNAVQVGRSVDRSHKHQNTTTQTHSVANTSRC